MFPSDQPEPSPRSSRVPPAPPAAPPTTGSAESPDAAGGWRGPARVVGLGKVALLSIISLAVAGWLLGFLSALLTFAAGAIAALTASRRRMIAGSLLSALIVTLGVALASSLVLQDTSWVGRVFRGLVLALAVTPAVVTLAIFHWARWAHSRASA